MKLTLPTPSGSSILEIKGMEISGMNTWLADNTKLYTRFFFKLGKAVLF